MGERLASSSRSRRRTTSRSQVVELVGSLSVHCDGDGGLKGSGRAGVSNEGRSIKASRRTRCRRAGTYRLEGGVRRRRILKGPESVGVGLSKAEESRETMQQLFVSKRKAPKSELSRRRERKKKSDETTQQSYARRTPQESLCPPTGGKVEDEDDRRESDAEVDEAGFEGREESGEKFVKKGEEGSERRRERKVARDFWWSVVVVVHSATHSCLPIRGWKREQASRGGDNAGKLHVYVPAVVKVRDGTWVWVERRTTRRGGCVMEECEDVRRDEDRMMKSRRGGGRLEMEKEKRRKDRLLPASGKVTPTHLIQAQSMEIMEATTLVGFLPSPQVPRQPLKAALIITASVELGPPGRSIQRASSSTNLLEKATELYHRPA